MHAADDFGVCAPDRVADGRETGADPRRFGTRKRGTVDHFAGPLIARTVRITLT